MKTEKRKKELLQQLINRWWELKEWGELLAIKQNNKDKEKIRILERPLAIKRLEMMRNVFKGLLKSGGYTESEIKKMGIQSRTENKSFLAVFAIN